MFKQKILPGNHYFFGKKEQLPAFMLSCYSIPSDQLTRIMFAGNLPHAATYQCDIGLRKTPDLSKQQPINT